MNFSIHVQDLTLSLGSGTILSKFSHEFQPGQWTHIIGPNGSGKTTLIRALAGLIRPAQGFVYLNNTPIHDFSIQERARILAYVPQRLEDIPPVRIIDFIEQSTFPWPTLTKAEIHHNALEALKETGISSLQNHRLDLLSGGERQLCILAAALAQNTDIILLDEPTTGLDIHHSLKIFDILQKISRQGKTVISSTHDIPLASQYADQTILLNDHSCLFHDAGFPDNTLLSQVFHVDHFLPAKIPILKSTDQADISSSTQPNPQKIRWVIPCLILAILLCFCPWLGATTCIPWENDTAHQIFFHLRIPRVLLGALSGCILSIVGATFQALFKNPLATPYTLGVASGASLGAFIAIQFGLVSLLFLPAASCFGGLLTMAAVLFLSRNARHSWFCLMTGIAASMFCTAAGLVVQSFATPITAQQMMHWQLGGLDIVGYSTFITAPLLCLAIIILFKYAQTLNILSVDTELAISRGINFRRTQTILLLITGIATSIIVSSCGPIGFVGLIIPNALRRFFGADLRRLLPLSAITGASFLILADTISRLLERFAWIPVGVITALIGAPIFIYALFKSSSLRQ